MYYGDGCTWEKPFVEPEWVERMDDDDGQAFAYNRATGVATRVVAVGFGSHRIHNKEEFCRSTATWLSGAIEALR